MRCSDNESHTSGDAVRNDVPVTERITGDMREHVHIAPKLLSTTQRNVSRAKPVPRMTHAGWELEQDSVRVRC